MAARLLPGTTTRVRRGRRHDFAGVQAVLGCAAGNRAERLYKRMTRDLGTDLYVAEEAGGAIVAVIALAYARSLLGGGLAAALEVARRSTEPRLGEGLVAFAEDRARRRGCRELAARIDGVDPELRAVLLARGFRPADALVAALVPAS